MVVIGRTGFPARKNAVVTTITRYWIVAQDPRRCDGTGTTTSASGIASKATHQIDMKAALHPSRRASATLVAVVAADVGPLQSVGRPDSAPAVVVGGVGVVGRAKERKAMEVVMVPAEMVMVPECEPCMRDSTMRKRRCRETAAADMHAAAHAAEVRA